MIPWWWSVIVSFVALGCGYIMGYGHGRDRSNIEWQRKASHANWGEAQQWAEMRQR